MKKLISLLVALCLLAMGIPALAETGAIDIDACAANAAESEVNAWAKAEAEKLPDDQKTLNIFTWADYVPPKVLDQFTDVTGIQVNYSDTLGNEDMLAKINAGTGLYDVVVLSGPYIATMVDLGLLSEIDSARIANFGNINPAYQGQYFDPDNKFAIPYTNYMPMIVYNPDMVDFEVTGFADLWRPEFKDKLSCVADMRDIIGMAQKKLGLSLNETDPAKMAEVGSALEELRPNLLSMNDDTPHNLLVEGAASAGFMYGSQIVAAQEVLPDLKVVYPKEGLAFGSDGIVVPKDAPHMDATYIFLNYILDAKVSAYASSLINYGSCNTAAAEFLPEEYKSNPTINAPEDLVKTAEMVMPLPDDALKLYDEIWVNFRQ